MDASGNSRAWEDNGSTTHSSTGHLPNSNLKAQMAVTLSDQTPNPTTFLPHDRTLPSLSSVFERNAIRSGSNHHIQSHDSGNLYSAEIKTPAVSDQGLKRPRLSQDQGRRVDGDISRSSGLGIVTVSSFGFFAYRETPQFSSYLLKVNSIGWNWT